MTEQRPRSAWMPKVKRLVVKIGSSSLTNRRHQLDRRVLRQLVASVVDLRQRGIEVAIVSSGAVAAGMGRLGATRRPRQIAELQALAAIGQNLLMHAYESLFRRHGVPVGQVLLTADDILDDRRRYLNLERTFGSLFKYGAVPIINENDSVAVAELKRQIGENDMLAAYVANLISAQLLVMLSDVEGLYPAYDDQGPRGELIHQVEQGELPLELAGKSASDVGRGGMETKLRAARLVTTCGEMAVIAHARKHSLVDIVEGGELGTLFIPANKKLRHRLRWIAFASACKGRIVVDRGAQQAIVEGYKSLLPAGVVACHGDFAAGESIRVENEAGEDLARGLSRYSAGELVRILGKSSPAIEATLGAPAREVIHRDDLVVLL